ncbi:MAG: nucleotidyltransferase domain-containing protein [Promethearchaeia archaeon]
MSLEWAKQQVTKHCDLAKTIILIGSHATDEATSTSDIDFIAITENANAAERIRRSISKRSMKDNRPLLDVKVYTEEEFRKAKSGKEHLFLWTALTTGQTLCGEDITQNITLNKRRLVNTVWEELQGVVDCVDKLEMRTRFTGCCFALHHALATMYFGQKFVLEHSRYSSKSVFMRNMLGNALDLVKDRYYYVASRVEKPELAQDIRIPASVDRKFSEADYNLVRQKCEKSMAYLRQKYSKVAEWAES